MIFKYVVLAKRTTDSSGHTAMVYTGFLFNEHAVHAIVAEALEAVYGKVVGAGFWDPVKQECWGESVSLNIKSRGDLDNQIIGAPTMFCVSCN